MRYPRKRMRCCACLLAGVAVWGNAQPGLADSVTFSGVIIQSTEDGTGPAVNNPSLNRILDGDAYSVTLLNFAGSISGPGTYALTPVTLAFSDPTAAASETSFGTFLCAAQSSLACLTISADGAFDDISLLACLTTGSGCLIGNELDANFEIPAASLNSMGVAASAIPLLIPLDLLEDDGVTVIQGSVTGYSYTGTSPIPEPSLLAPLLLLLAPLAWVSARQLRRPATPC